MLLHVPTLTLATLAVSATLSVLLFCTWLQGREERALLYWAPAGFAGAAGKALLPAGSVVAAHALFIIWAGLTWCGARAFAGRRPQIEWVVAAALGWIAISQADFMAQEPALRVALVSMLRAVFTVLTIIEFWGGRDETLFSRWTAIGALTIHAAALLSRLPVVAFVHLPPEPDIFQTGWFGVAAMGQLLYTTAITFILLAMTKERVEVRHKQAARTDSLTALLNRRAFMAEGVACLHRSLAAGEPVAVLMFDLDRFKAINDRFGHAAGDRVLQRFAATLRVELPSVGISGRLGGEEFAALLPGCDQRGARAIAERITGVFAAGAASEDGHIVATVSVGIAVATRAQDLVALLADADRAVYQAKRSGRNCVRAVDATAQDRQHTAPSLAA